MSEDHEFEVIQYEDGIIDYECNVCGKIAFQRKNGKIIEEKPGMSCKEYLMQKVLE